MSENGHTPIKVRSYRKMMVSELKNHTDQLNDLGELIKLQNELLEKQSELLEDAVDGPSLTGVHSQ